jgi:hypothetical protein
MRRSPFARGYLTQVYSTSHCYDFVPLPKCGARIGDEKTAGIGDSNAWSCTLEDRKFELVFKITDLLTEGRLRKI